MENEKKIKWVVRFVGVLIALGIVMLVQPFVLVPAGHRGIVLNWGAVSDNVMNEGLNFKIPVMQKIKIVEVRTIKLERPAVSYSKDLQTVEAAIALTYHLEALKVNKLYQEVGGDYQGRIIDPAVQESVKAVTAKFTAPELVDQRAKVKDEIKASLAERLLAYDIIVEDVSITNFEFSQVYEQAIEAKQVAQQNALKAENELVRIKVEAEQKIATARAEAESIRIQAQAINSQGGADFVALQAIAKWDGRLPVQMIPNSSVPFINLSK